MGQRFQTVVSCSAYKLHGGDEFQVSTTRRAGHLQWCWGPHAVMRAAQAVNVAAANLAHNRYAFLEPEGVVAGVFGSFCINQRTGTVQGLSEYENLDEWLDSHGYSSFDNNDGVFLLEFSAPETHSKVPCSFSFGFVSGEGINSRSPKVVGVDEYLREYGREVELWREDEQMSGWLDEALEVLRSHEQEGRLMLQERCDVLLAAKQDSSPMVPREHLETLAA